MLSHSRRGEEAHALFDVALSSAVEAGDRIAEIKARHELAILAFEGRRFEDAARLLHENVQGAREIGAADLEAAALFELGLVVLRGDEDHETAHRLFTEARGLAALLGDRSTELSALLYLGDIEQERRDYPASIDTLTRCIAGASEIDAGAIQATALVRRARSYALVRDRDRALADLEEARALAGRWHPALMPEIEALGGLLHAQ